MTFALGYHPAVLGLRFVLGLAALACFAYGAWRLFPGASRYIGS